MRWSISYIIWVLWTMPVVDWFSRQIDSLRKARCSLQETVTCDVAFYCLSGMKRKLQLLIALLMYLKHFKCILVVMKGLDMEHWRLSCHLLYCDSGTERLLLIASTFIESSRLARLLYSQFDHSPLYLILAYLLRWGLNLVGFKKTFILICTPIDWPRMRLCYYT